MEVVIWPRVGVGRVRSSKQVLQATYCSWQGAETCLLFPVIAALVEKQKAGPTKHLRVSEAKESKSKAPKRPSKPPAPDFDMADEPPPYCPERKLPETRPHPLALPPPKQSETPKEISIPPPLARTWSNCMFPLRVVAGPEGPIRVHVPFSISDMNQIEEKLGSFSENPTRYKKEFLKLTQACHLT